MLTDLELKALKIRKNKTLLRRRLQQARSVLTNENQKVMKNAHFDPINNRLVSRCGRYSLQWLLRPEPTKPISYHNQQTAQGVVVFKKHNPTLDKIRDKAMLMPEIVSLALFVCQSLGVL